MERKPIRGQATILKGSYPMGEPLFILLGKRPLCRFSFRNNSQETLNIGSRCHYGEPWDLPEHIEFQSVAVVTTLAPGESVTVEHDIQPISPAIFPYEMTDWLHVEFPGIWAAYCEIYDADLYPYGYLDSVLIHDAIHIEGYPS